MTKQFLNLLAALTLAAFVTGCAPKDELAVAPEPSTSGPTIEQGTVREDLVGTWTTDQGQDSTMILNADGTSSIVSKVGTRGGMQETNVAGRWSEIDGKLIFEDSSSTPGAPITLRYPYTLEDGKLTLEVGSVGGSMTYEKQNQD
jgi:hypothetical protein